MNNGERIAPFALDASGILGTFLTSLLGQESTITASAPVSQTLEETETAVTDSFLAIGQSPEGAGFAIALDSGWIPLLSQALLSEEVAAKDPKSTELFKDAVAQAYEAIRSELNIPTSLPEIAFTVVAPGEGLPIGSLEDAVWSIEFELSSPDSPLKGILFLSDSLAIGLGDEPAPEETTEDTEVPAQAAAEPQINMASTAFPELGREDLLRDRESNYRVLSEVELMVTVELGRRRLPLSDVLQLTTGSVIELEKLVGEPLEIYANGRLIAEGEAVVIDEQFGVRVTSLATRQSPITV